MLIKMFSLTINIDMLANDIGEPDFCHYLQCFLQDYLEPDVTSLPFFLLTSEKDYIHSSATTSFYAPSDICGTGGMHHEHMHVVTSWRCGKPQYDCVFINIDKHKPGMFRLSIAHARLFFSIKVNCIKHSCALVHWYYGLRDSVDENTGMWVVEPDILDDGRHQTAVIHLDMIVCLGHLFPIYGEQAPKGVMYMDSLDIFSTFYVNKFTDHHVFEIVF